MKQTLVLVILDGWGIGKADESNPIYIANPPVLRSIQENFPCGALQASGIAVGLPWEEEGNSEVGHLVIGAGKTLYQHFPRISLAVHDGTFFENETFKQAFAHAEKNNAAVHCVGLLTNGNAHASFAHLAALITMAKQRYCKQLYLHLFTDGRDSPPRSVLTLIEKLREEIKKQESAVTVASIAGRYYGMDRDEHWERTEKAYRALTDAAPLTASVEEAVRNAYAKQLDDQFIEPAAIQESHPIASNDAIIFFNFREDRMRQITAPFLIPSFDKFKTKKLENIFIATMTQYDEKVDAHVAFPNETVENPLGKVLSDNGKIQLRVAETDKYAHITYFFNGLREEPFPNESRILIPTKSGGRHDAHPEMMAQTVTDRTLLALNEGRFDFILVNYANADLVAHTGNYIATIEAIKVLGKELERLITAAFSENHLLVITADHGNAEVLLDEKTGEPETKHNQSPVPFYLIGQKFKKTLNPQPSTLNPQLPVIGILADVAPTILELMGIPKPEEMTGQSLLEQLT